ncbi:MAG: YraN family protein [Desulfurococcaceae archaeon]
MSISAKRKWRSSEEIAIEFLEENGYRVIDRNTKVFVNNVEVGEVDAIVEDSNGNRYAVEIKAGTIDVNGIRQIYVNSQLLGYKPLVVAKGYADESAEKLAEKLGVITYLLSDRFITDAEELETIVYSSIRRLIEEILDTLNKPYPSPDDLFFLEKIASSKTIQDLAEKTNRSINEVAEKIKELRDKGLIDPYIRNFQEIRLQAQLIVLRERFKSVFS